MDVDQFSRAVDEELNGMTPDEFARGFLEAPDGSRFIMGVYITKQPLERRDEIRERIAYYSCPPGDAEL